MKADEGSQTSVWYRLKVGEHINIVAGYFGFATLDPITEHPDNQSLINARGGIERLKPGDIITIPEGTAGKKDLAPGRGHVLTVKVPPKKFTLMVEASFRLFQPEHDGDLTKSPSRWIAFGKSTVKVAGAIATIAQAGGGVIYTNVTNKRGELDVPRLDDGAWTIELEPDENERSAGPAGGDKTADHGLGYFTKRNTPGPVKPSRPFPANGFYEVEYRPVRIKLEVVGGVVDSAAITSPAQGERAVPAVPFWKNVGETDDRQCLHVNWKPDYLRRVHPVLNPEQRKRTLKADEAIDLIVVHQTGCDLTSTLSTFLPKSGASSGAQFVNDIDGHVIRLADDIYYTRHAGGYEKQRKPEFCGGRVGDRALGIENVHKDDTTHLDPSKNPFPDAQYASLVDLIRSLQGVHGVTKRRVIGHQEATPKVRCPGPHFEWPRLERADVALAPTSLSVAQVNEMFGGYFAGTEGSARVLKVGDRDEPSANGFRVMRGKEVLADRLTRRPIKGMYKALYALGYDAEHPILQAGGAIGHSEGEFDKSLAFCLVQFVRRFASGERLRLDQSAAYNEIDLKAKKSIPKVTLDLELAKLLRGAETAAQAFPRTVDVREIRDDE